MRPTSFHRVHHWWGQVGEILGNFHHTVSPVLGSFRIQSVVNVVKSNSKRSRKVTEVIRSRNWAATEGVVFYPSFQYSNSKFFAIVFDVNSFEFVFHSSRSEKNDWARFLTRGFKDVSVCYMSKSVVISEGISNLHENLSITRGVIVEKSDNECLRVSWNFGPFGLAINIGRGGSGLTAHVAYDSTRSSSSFVFSVFLSIFEHFNSWISRNTIFLAEFAVCGAINLSNMNRRIFLNKFISGSLVFWC